MKINLNEVGKWVVFTTIIFIAATVIRMEFEVAESIRTLRSLARVGQQMQALTDLANHLPKFDQPLPAPPPAAEPAPPQAQPQHKARRQPQRKVHRQPAKQAPPPQ